MKSFQSILLFLATIGLLSPHYPVAYGANEEELQALINYSLHILEPAEFSALSSGSGAGTGGGMGTGSGGAGESSNPYEQCMGLWGGAGAFHKGQQAKIFDANGINGVWDEKAWASLGAKALGEFNQPNPSLEILKKLQEIFRIEIQNITDETERKEALAQAYYAYLFSKFVIKGMSLYKKMHQCTAIYIMTSKHTDATRGDQYEPKAMGMMMMMGMGGMGGMSGMGTMGGMGGAGMMGTGMNGMGNLGSGMMGGGAMGMNPMMMMMMGGSVKCSSAGPQTQDFHDCKRIVQMFDASMMAQQAAQTAEQMQMGQSQIDAQKKMLENNATSGTVQLEVLKDQANQQAQIAFSRAAFETIKTAGFGALWQSMPTLDSIKKLCLQSYPQNLGDVSFEKYINKIKTGILDKLSNPDTNILEKARSIIKEDLKKDFTDLTRELDELNTELDRFRVKSESCRTSTTDSIISEWKSKIEAIKDRIEPLKTGRNDSERANIEDEITTIKQRINKLYDSICPDSKASDEAGKTDKHTDIHHHDHTFFKNKKSLNNFAKILIDNLVSINKAYAQENFQVSLLNLNPPVDPDSPADLIIKELINIYNINHVITSSSASEFCTDAFQPDFLPNQATRDFAKMMTVQAGSMMAANAMKGGLANNQANEIQSVIDNLKNKKDSSNDGQQISDDLMDTECRENPELEKCKKYAGARQQIGFSGLSEKTLSGGDPGGIINSSGTSSSFDDKRAASKGTADANKVGGALGSLGGSSSPNRGSGFESMAPGPTRVKSTPSSGRSGGGGGMGGASAPGGGGSGGTNAPGGGDSGGNVLANSGIRYEKQKGGQYNQARTNPNNRQGTKENPFEDLFKKANQKQNGGDMNLPQGVLPAQNELFNRIGDAYQRNYEKGRMIKYDTIY